jgi:hypothetical protein
MYEVWLNEHGGNYATRQLVAMFQQRPTAEQLASLAEDQRVRPEWLRVGRVYVIANTIGKLFRVYATPIDTRAIHAAAVAVEQTRPQIRRTADRPLTDLGIVAVSHSGQHTSSTEDDYDEPY